jgi:hypothetical protein
MITVDMLLFCLMKAAMGILVAELLLIYLHWDMNRDYEVISKEEIRKSYYVVYIPILIFIFFLRLGLIVTYGYYLP